MESDLPKRKRAPLPINDVSNHKNMNKFSHIYFQEHFALNGVKLTKPKHIKSSVSSVTKLRDQIKEVVSEPRFKEKEPKTERDKKVKSVLSSHFKLNQPKLINLELTVGNKKTTSEATLSQISKHKKGSEKDIDSISTPLILKNRLKGSIENTAERL